VALYKWLLFLILFLTSASSFSQSVLENDDIYRKIKSEIDKIELIDTHEHLMSKQERMKGTIDFFYMFSHYASSDLVSSGMSNKDLTFIRNPENSLEERWKLFYPYWEDIKNTGYAKALKIAAKGLYNINEINNSTYKELSRKITMSNNEEWYDNVLKEKANIKKIIFDVINPDDIGLNDFEKGFFYKIGKFDHFVYITRKEHIKIIEKKHDKKIRTIDDFISVLDKEFGEAVDSGIVGIKSALAYARIIKYDDVKKEYANAVFNKILNLQNSERLSFEEAKPLQDYMMHQILQRAVTNKLPIQIHTGLLEGNGNRIMNSNPYHLVNLFFKYPKAKFIIFHGSYPFCNILSTLAKNFRNVYIDMCWMYIISESVTKRYLHEWIETVPSNKIMGFGGDYIFIEGTYAHSVMAKSIVAEVLTEKVKSGYFTVEEAIEFAQKILNKNALEIFKLN